MITIDIDARVHIGRLAPFWRASGFSPGQLLLTPEMRTALALVGATPNGGVTYLRPHYLLDLVSATRNGASLACDWSLLDRAVDTMIEFGFRPFFELMGNPSHLFSDFNDRDQVQLWFDFTTRLLQRLQDRHGAEAIRSWYFESWNEPDIWWRLGGEDSFLNYYDACVAAVDAVDPGLTIGGPGTAHTMSSMFRRFIAHCDSGENTLTRNGPPRLDFVSVHEKGAPRHLEDLPIDSVGICRREMLAAEHIRTHHPRLRHVPLINNECDPQVGWWDVHTWNATAFAPAIMAKIVDQHQRLVIDKEKVDFSLLANDNGFLGSWGHRTQLAYFGERSFSKAQSEFVTDLSTLGTQLETEKPFAFVRKPALIVMDFLAQLGPQRVAATGNPALDPERNGLGVLATTHADGRLAVLLYNSLDNPRRSAETPLSLDIALEGGAAYDYKLFEIAGEAGFDAWAAAGAPATPTQAQLRALRQAVEFTEVAGGTAAGHLHLSLQAALPGVYLLLAEPVGRGATAKPSPLPTIFSVAPDGGREAVLRWSAEPAGFTRYEIALGVDPHGPFEPIGIPTFANAAATSLRPDHSYATITPVTLADGRGPVLLIPLTVGPTESDG